MHIHYVSNFCQKICLSVRTLMRRKGCAVASVVLAALLLSLVGIRSAQAQVSASLTGVITDPSGAPVPAAAA